MQTPSGLLLIFQRAYFLVPHMQNSTTPKRLNVSDQIRQDPRAIDLIMSSSQKQGPGNKRIKLHREIEKLGYNLSASNLSVLVAKLRGTWRPALKKAASPQNVPTVPATQSIILPPKVVEASEVVADVKIAEPQKSAPSDTPELVIDIPGIYEVQNRGKGYTSFRFESPIDGSIFSFPSWAEARTARKSMMAVFRQQAVFDGVVRQKTGKKPATDEFDE
jgi:hypothetical protein